MKRSDAKTTKLPIKIISSKISNYEDTMRLFDKKPNGCGLYRLELGLIRDNQLSLRALLSYDEIKN